MGGQSKKNKNMRKEYITQFFNKDPENLNINDLRDFFLVRQDENSTLEFKSGEVEIDDLYKEVTAFLNTEGGMIIVGAPRETKDKYGKRVVCFCQGELTFSKFISKDWLNQKLFSNITPSPTDIYVKEFITEQGNVFIIDVPQSMYPPHQSNCDGRYYIRIDNEAKPAPHGLVQALFDKRRKPKLNAQVKRTPIDDFNDKVVFSIHNDSEIPADKVAFLVDVFNVESVNENSRFREMEDELFRKKFTYSDSSNQVLVSVIQIGNSFRLKHYKKNYLVSVNYWCKDTDFDCTYFIIDPINGTISSYNWLDEGASLTKTLENLIEDHSEQTYM